MFKARLVYSCELPYIYTLCTSKEEQDVKKAKRIVVTSTNYREEEGRQEIEAI